MGNYESEKQKYCRKAGGGVSEIGDKKGTKKGANIGDGSSRMVAVISIRGADEGYCDLEEGNPNMVNGSKRMATRSAIQANGDKGSKEDSVAASVGAGRSEEATADRRSQVDTLNEIKDMGVDRVLGMMEELFAHLVEGNEAKQDKARRCLKAMREMRKILKVSKVPRKRMEDPVEERQETPKSANGRRSLFP